MLQQNQQAEMNNTNDKNMPMNYPFIKQDFKSPLPPNADKMAQFQNNLQMMNSGIDLNIQQINQNLAQNNNSGLGNFNSALASTQENQNATPENKNLVSLDGLFDQNVMDIPAS